MSGLEFLTGNEKLSILQCQELAKDVGFDSTEFTLCGPKGELKAKWLDAHMGLFQIEGADGFNTVGQFQYAKDLWCKDILPQDDGTHNE